MSSSLLKYIYCPLYRKTKGFVWDRDLVKFKKLERRKRALIESRQWELLKKLLSFAYENVNYYRNLFKRLSLTPEDIRTAADFKKIPILTKRDIMENFDELMPLDISERKPFLNSSGGSTGVSLNFYQDDYYQKKRVSGVYWGNELAGWRFGEPTAYLWGVDDERLASARDSLNRFLKNEMILNTFNMDRDDMKGFYKKLLRFRVKFIIGYASSLDVFFRFLKKENLRIPTLKSVISSAEVLHKEVRDFLQTEYGVQVFDRYGSREVGLISAECEAHKGMHIYTDNVYLEVEPCSLASREGEVIVTSLINYAMPFIRYKIEDFGILDESPCSCGRNLQKIKSIIGRSTSVFTTPDGRLVHGEYFTHLFYGLKEIKSFQFIQKNLKYYILKIVPGEGFTKGVLLPVVDKIKKMLKTEHIEIKVVDSIEPAKSGKHIFTLSEVQVKL